MNAEITTITLTTTDLVLLILILLSLMITFFVQRNDRENVIFRTIFNIFLFCLSLTMIIYTIHVDHELWQTVLFCIMGTVLFICLLYVLHGNRRKYIKSISF